MIKSQWECLKK